MMLKRIITSVILAVAAILMLSSQEQLRIPPGISGAFKTGNAVELSKYFNGTVQIMLFGKEDFYKKNVAETILKDYFSQHRISDFVIKHQGGTADAQYAIGKLKTDKGEFRIYFLLKKVGNELLIHQLRIEPDDGK